MHRIDVPFLRGVLDCSQDIEVILSCWTRRKNYRPITTSTAVEAEVRSVTGHSVSEAEIVKLFKALETAGCGRYRRRYGKRPDQFEWRANLKIHEVAIRVTSAPPTRILEPVPNQTSIPTHSDASHSSPRRRAATLPECHSYPGGADKSWRPTALQAHPQLSGMTTKRA